ncbi:TSUP family transporter [Gammaproteobacteria bacterium]|nr:TSUP family transporter [Gammaproteobacteria bacterium]
MSMLVFTLIIILTTLGTAFLSSIFGMLGGVILMGILVSIMPVSQAMVLHGLIQLTSNGYRAWLNRKDINWSIVATIIVGNIIALAGLVFVAFVPDRITVLLALGLLPYIAWALPKNAALDVSKKPIGLLAGMVVVATNLLAGVGGPLLDVFFQRVDMTRHQVVATKAVAQSLGHISKVIFFGFLTVSASNDWPVLWLVLIAMTASVTGTTLGKKILDKINDEIFFLWTQRILLSVGAVFIVYALYLISL